MEARRKLNQRRVYLCAGALRKRASGRFVSFSRCGVENKSGRIRDMNPKKTTITILAALSVSLALAADFKTNNGKEYKNAIVTQVDPDGIVVKTKTSISKLYFLELTEDVRTRYHYDPEKAAAAQAAAVQQTEQINRQAAELDKQQKEQHKQQAEQVAKQQNVQALMDRSVELQQEEENLRAKIGRVENTGAVSWSRWNTQGSVHVYANDPARADLPLLRGRLENVREEKQKVTAELNRAQRESR
jgi:hypothetical protein